MTTIQKEICKALLSMMLAFFVSCKSGETMTVVNSKLAPQAIGPYSQAIKTGNYVFCSGQIGLSPETGQMAGEDISSQTNQALKNIQAILQEAGTDFMHVTKVTIFITDMKNYSTVNEIYAKYFVGVKPARSAVQVSALPKNALVEIECIATMKSKKMDRNNSK